MKSTPTVANHIISAVLSHVRNNKDPLLPAALHPRERNPFAAEAAVSKISEGDPNPPAHDPNADTSILHLGVDWGATKTTLKASYAGSTQLHLDQTIPTVLGFAKEGLVDSTLPENATTLFGHQALTHRRHLHLTHPTIQSDAAAEFARHLRSLVNVAPETEIRAVIAVPANFDAALREHFRQTIAEHFESVILLPAPYLAALAYFDSDDGKSSITPSILIDLGATHTTLCLLQGHYPSPQEQLTLDFGGNHIDQNLRAAILEKHPEAELSPITIRLLKEKHACAGQPAKPIHADIILAGKPTTLDLTDQITSVSDELLYRTHTAIKDLVEASQLESRDLQIILTGAGSRMKGIAEELYHILAANLFAEAQVAVAPENANSLIVTGALKAARHAREHQWQQVLR